MITQIKYPSRAKGLMLAVLFSVLAHAVVLAAIRIAPIVRMAMGLSEIEYVDKEYNRAILIDFSKRLVYPDGYMGFRAPKKTKSLDDMKKEEERLRRLKERQKRERELAEKRAAEERAKAEEKAKAEMAKAEAKPTPTPDGYGSFGKINTRPISDQIHRLYQAKIDGKLIIPEGKFKIGVTGSVNPDGTLQDYRVHVPSGIQDIDDSAMAILAAVSESRALGPLAQLTSITMVLDIDQQAQLTVTGFARSENEALAFQFIADLALREARRKKAGDEAAMIMLNNLKVTRTGNRLQAVISVPKEMAKETLARMMDKK